MNICAGMLDFNFSNNMQISKLNDVLAKTLGFNNTDELFGYYGRNVINLLSEQTKSVLEKEIEDMEKLGEESRDIWEINVYLRKKGGRYISFLGNASITNKAGSSVQMFLICNERERQEQNLKSRKLESLIKWKKEIELFISNVPVGLHRCKLDGSRQIDFISDGLSQMLGYTFNDIVDLFDSKYVNMIVEENRDLFKRAMTDLSNYPHVREIKYKMVCKNGDIISVSDTIKSVRHDSGEMTAYGVVSRDDETSNIKKPQMYKYDIYIRMFGVFDVFVKGTPISFKNKKAKELLAVLVDFEGSFVSRESIISRLWEDEPASDKVLSRLRATYKQLKDTLEAHGIGYIIESASGSRRVCIENFVCDYYEYLKGNEEFKPLFKGEYISEYSWGELTLATIINQLHGT